MTTAEAASPRRELILGIRREWNEDTRQFLAVILVALVALAIGYGVREWATGQTRTITVGSVSAAIPSSWVVQQGSQDLLFTAADPRNPGQRYSVTQPTDLGSDPNTVANATVAGKSQVLSAVPGAEPRHLHGQRHSGPGGDVHLHHDPDRRRPAGDRGLGPLHPGVRQRARRDPGEPGARLRGGARPIQDVRGIGEGVADVEAHQPRSEALGRDRRRRVPSRSRRSARWSSARAPFPGLGGKNTGTGVNPAAIVRVDVTGTDDQGQAVSASAYGVVVDSSGLVHRAGERRRAAHGRRRRRLAVAVPRL